MQISTAPSHCAILKTLPRGNVWTEDGISFGLQTTHHRISLEHAHGNLEASRNWHQWNYLVKAVNRIILRWLLFCGPTTLTVMSLWRDNQRRHIEQIKQMQAMRFGSHNSSLFYEENEHE